MFIAIYTTIGIIIYNITEFSLLRSGHPTWLYYILVVTSALMTRAPSGNDRYGVGLEAARYAIDNHPSN